MPLAVLRSKRGFFVESLRERFFTPAAWWRRRSGVVNASLPYCPIQASATSARSCGLKVIAPTDGARESRDGTLKMVGPSSLGALCVSLTPRSLDEVFSSDLTGADCVEVRLDYLTNPQESIHTRWDRLPVPVIATFRRNSGRPGFADGSRVRESRTTRKACHDGAVVDR